MAVTNYYSVGGMLVGEETSGVRTDYLTDALGSVTATVDQTGTIQNAYRYKPYGGLLAKTGSATDPKFGWVGTEGYRQTGRKYSDTYVRARHYGCNGGRWTSVDPLWPDEHPYNYVASSPMTTTDPSGLKCNVKMSGLFETTTCTAACVNNCCTFDFQFQLHLDFSTKGCTKCNYYQWFVENGVLKKDDCNAAGGVHQWPSLLLPSPLTHYTDGDSPGVSGAQSPCESPDYNVSFIGCICCAEGCTCMTWQYLAFAPDCANPTCLPKKPVKLNAVPNARAKSMCANTNQGKTNVPCQKV